MATAPGLTQWLPLPYGPFGAFLRDTLGYQLQARQKYGDVFRLRAGPMLIHFLFHPDHVRHVLQEQQKNYLRGWQYQLLRSLLGNNLVVSEGDYWMRQRRLAQPAFLRQRLAGYADVMVDATSQALARWGEMSAIDTAPEMSRLALAIAGRTLFSRDVSGDADVVGTAFGVIAKYLDRRLNHPFTTLPAWVPTPASVRFKRAVRTLNEIGLAIIRERRREDRDVGDLLSMLMQARDEETGATMTDEQLRSEVLTFFIAGHETTATALTWTAFLLASHPEQQQMVRDEVLAVLGDRPPTFAGVMRLERTRMVIEESLRLYPPVWGVVRQPAHDDQLAGFHIPARCSVVLCSYITQRHPDFWEQADVFDPERFTSERAAARHKGAYFPFLSGPHQCIGNEFALLEMRIIVAMIVREFELTLVPGPSIRPVASLTLRPSAPVRIQIRRVAQLLKARLPSA